MAVGKGSPQSLLVGMSTSSTLPENNVSTPQKLSIELPYDPVIPLLCIYPKGPKTLFRKDICIPMCITVLVTIAKI